jgi:hypothetical protein
MDRNQLNRLARQLKLLTVGNTKILRSLDTSNYLTVGLHLAPAWESGRNTCAMHTKECAATCLHFAGRGAMSRVQQARIRRTNQFFDNRADFLSQFAADLRTAETFIKPLGYQLAVRPNLTSDIRWEAFSIINDFSHLVWYDYTKMLNRSPPPNYHLTFSFSGDNIGACQQALAFGMNVAVPFLKLPSTWLGYPVVDGDEDDLRFLTQGPCIVGLKAKGRLRRNPKSKFLGDNHCPISLPVSTCLSAPTMAPTSSATTLGGPTTTSTATLTPIAAG